MSLILAIEADRRQISKIAALAKGPLHAELVAAETTERGIKALDGRVPDLILTSLLLSPKDDAKLTDWLRELDAAGRHVQTLVIPVLGVGSNGSQKGGLLTRLRGSRGRDAAPDGCDPAMFAAQISDYLERAAEERRAAAVALEDRREAADRRQKSVVSRQSSVDSHPSAVDSFDQAIDNYQAPISSESSADIYQPVVKDYHSVVLNQPKPETRTAEQPLAKFQEPAFFVETGEPIIIPDDALVAAPMHAEPFVEASIPAHPFVEAPTPDDPVVEASILFDPVVEEPIVRRGDILGLSGAVPASPELAAEEESSQIASEESWQSVAIETEETDASVELTAEAIDLAAFVAELKAIGSGLEAHAEPLPADEPVALDIQDDIAMSPPSDSRWSPVERQAPEPEIPAPQAADIPPPAAAPAASPAVPEWIQLLTAIRNDIEQLRSDLPEAASKSEKDADRHRDAAPAPPAPVDRSKKKKKKTPPPLQDEWGFFDPDQCGFAALLAKLDEISEEEDKPDGQAGKAGKASRAR